MKLGAAKKEAGRAYFLVEIRLPEDEEDLKTNGFDFSLRKNKLRQVRRREGRFQPGYWPWLCVPWGAQMTAEDRAKRLHFAPIAAYREPTRV